GPRARSSHDQVGLRADRSRRARAEALGLGLGLVAAHRLEAPGEDDRLAAPFGLLGIADEWQRGDFRQQIVERLPVVRLVEEIDALAAALSPKSLDIACARRHDMPQPLEPLRRTYQAAGAADVRLAFRGDCRGIAHRAVVGRDMSLAWLIARQILDHLRDDVAG